MDMTALSKIKVETIAQDLLSSGKIEKKVGDRLKRSFLRHDSEKLAKIIWGLA
jgi:hypothetical protein